MGEMGTKSLDTESRTAQVYSKEMGFISSLAPVAKLQFRQGKKAEAASEMRIPDRRGHRGSIKRDTRPLEYSTHHSSK